MKVLDKNFFRRLNPYQDIEEIESKKDKYFNNVTIKVKENSTRYGS